MYASSDPAAGAGTGGAGTPSVEASAAGRPKVPTATASSRDSLDAGVSDRTSMRALCNTESRAPCADSSSRQSLTELVRGQVDVDGDRLHGRAYAKPSLVQRAPDSDVVHAERDRLIHQRRLSERCAVDPDV